MRRRRGTPEESRREAEVGRVNPGALRVVVVVGGFSHGRDRSAPARDRRRRGHPAPARSSRPARHRAVERARARSGDRKPHPVEPAPGGHVERLPVRIAKGEVGRELRRQDGAEVLARGREDPDSARTRDVEVAALVHLEPVEGLLAGRARSCRRTRGRWPGRRPGALRSASRPSSSRPSCQHRGTSRRERTPARSGR